MNNRWSDTEAAACRQHYASQWGEELAMRTYSSRLLGAEKGLVLHGGGNTSVKGRIRTILGQEVPAVFVKASGWNLATIEPEGHPALDLAALQPLSTLAHLDDTAMVNELRIHLFQADAATPSIEALLHVFLPHTFIDHTHADAILTLTNQFNGDRLLREALGMNVLVLPYVHPGFALAKAVAELYATAPHSRAMVLMHHGLITWGKTAQESYATTIDLVTRAETFIAKRAQAPKNLRRVITLATAQARYLEAAPLLRGKLAIATNNPDQPYQRFLLSPVINREVLNLVDSEAGKTVLITPPLTTDHLIRTKALPLWIDDIDHITETIAEYQKNYLEMFERNADPAQPLLLFDPSPRMIFMPGIGAICVGKNSAELEIVRDILLQTLAVKARIAAMGGSYLGLSEAELFAMETFPLQRKKLGITQEPPLARRVALITGAAGAIGAGICRELVANGCHVAAADLPGVALTSLATEINQDHPGYLLPVVMDVTSPESVTAGFNQVVERWGGLDLLVPNAGLAHVASLEEMKLAAFQKLQKVNVEGTLLVLGEAARLFRRQGTGGDVVMISTKNVFSPGARFGAYSATKAAAHQLTRIASLEMAEMDVRVNMVAPDGVFADGARPSGLWAEVGPDRMKARGLDADGLQEYYRNRNLLKARISATHVARAVLFFATRQTPTTGATLPVDGGLPDATPR
ncbi:MAG: bifunctional aldolase/short-chain dehydrogenase [Magnetococcales bacterium]|nr:bifunctional aldolase/short-chain dehydrogenase [Magnetococcales bacterium]MBF0439644.1 bifunctional aldolase/short-chain dehydrogenase [Magnetococcales bacterium]